MKKITLQVRENNYKEVLVENELVPMLMGFEMNVLSGEDKIGDIVVTSSGGLYVNLDTGLQPSVLKSIIVGIHEKMQIEPAQEELTQGDAGSDKTSDSTSH